MRRISPTSAPFKKAIFSEMAFLQHLPILPTQNSDLDTSRIHHKDESSIPAGSNLPTTRAMKLLANAVRRSDFSRAENVFARVPRLAQRPAALRLMIKLYCEQLDFRSAKALLFASLDKVGEKGASRFIAHCTYTSQNAKDIEEVTNRVIRELGEASADFLANSLFGLRFLNDMEAFDRIWRLATRQWEPSLRPPTLLAKALDAMLSQNWDLAARLWRIARGLSRGHESIPEPRIWYMACRYFLVEEPQVACVDRILALMSKLEVKISPTFSALLLRHLAPQFPAMTASQWAQYAIERGWPLDGSAVEVIVANCQGGLTRRFGPQLGDSLLKYALQKSTSSGLSTGRRRLGEGPRFRSDIAALHQAECSGDVLSVLSSMVKHGLRIPYDVFVQAFHRLTQLGGGSGLQELVSMFRAHDYPIHCAATDLSMLELHCHEAHFDSQFSQRLLGEYLIQYPLVSHDLSGLTRMAIVLLNSGAFAEAALLADSVRCDQQNNARFSSSNHDCASLQVLASAKFRMQEPVAPFLRGVISDSPLIYFDRKFVRKAKRMLVLGNEELDILDELSAANERTLQATYADIDRTVELVKQNHSDQPPPDEVA